jgi:hypothetical protein
MAREMMTVTSPEIENHATVPTSNGDRQPADVVNSYLNAFYAGEFDAAGSLLANNFDFRGPFVQVKGKGPFLESASGLRDIVRGHKLIRQWTDGAEVSSIYEVSFVTPYGAGAIVMSEWHVIAEGLLSSGQVIFDSAAFRALLLPT